jgi:sigma-B regulation protein RsbU (phosphoserine phosphatase)
MILLMAPVQANPRRGVSRISIRLLVAIVVIVPLVVVSAALVALSIISNQKISHDLGNEIVGDATSNIRRRVVDYLGASVRVSDLYARRVAEGRLPTKNLEAWRMPMLEDMLSDPRVVSICFANTDGDAVWLSRFDAPVPASQPASAPQPSTQNAEHELALEFGWSDGGTKNQVGTIVDEHGKEIARIPERSAIKYDPSSRPYWKAALASETPVWTQIYFWYSNKGSDTEASTGYTRKVFDANGKFAGVLVVDSTLRAMSDFLKQLPAAKDGQIFLVDETGKLVAASTGPVTSEAGERITMREGKTSAGIAAAPLLEAKKENESVIMVENEQSWARVAPIEFKGIHWRALVVLPEHLFMTKAREAQSRALLLASFAVLAALVLGFFLAKRIVKPLLALANHVEKIGAGDFEARLHLRAARELSDLSEAVNTMAVGLKSRVQLQASMAVATQVQQSLLPAASPTSTRLDIYGASKYCEQAGGDYYDFISVGDLPDDRALVAIGDVMGHGIGAALLMASARAALRATALRSGALGELLSAVNIVLSRDNRHGRFMTMLLVLLEPEQGKLRWASAGHDCPLIYEPRAEEFIELEGGDIPLGVDADIKYEEYTFPALNPHQVMVLGTDGIWEARNAKNELFGKERLKDILKKTSDKSAREIARAIDQTLADYMGDSPSLDDVTFIVVKILPVDARLKLDVSNRISGTE